MRKSIPAANLISVQRVQNVPLWEKYGLNKVRFWQRHKGKVNEQWLFHGTGGRALESVWENEEGFDTRHYKNAGVNFYITANDANAAASTFGGTRQLFLAQVLIGASFPADGNQPVAGAADKSDSTFNGTNMYTIKRNEQAYPVYLLTYS